MQYRKDRNGNPISILGYGCMRFTKNGNDIDLEKAEKELLCAIENGVNYLDTAYVYSGSEEALGKILSKAGCRDKVNLATKLPHYLIRSKKGAEKKFQEELVRLQTSYIDYYLMHMLNDVKTWEHLLSLGIGTWIEEKKKSGEIKNIGFSYHGNTDNFKELLDAYDWDFCQIQYNYLDEYSQAGKNGLLYAAEKGIPVIIMEPLRGGRLVNDLPNKAKELIAEAGRFQSDNSHSYTPAELGLRWLWNQPQVTCVLSGMNSLEMVQENIRIANEVSVNSFTEKQFELIEEVKKQILSNVKVSCTGCSYCMPCPQHVDIPMAFHCYNLKYTQGKNSGKWEYIQSTAMRRITSSASQCVGCGKCEKHCPQGIPIREKLKEAAKELESPYYKLMKWGVHLLKIY